MSYTKSKALQGINIKTNNILDDIRKAMESTQEIIIELENYGNNDHHIKLPIALKQAEIYLNDLMKHSDKIPDIHLLKKCANHQYEFWSDELQNVKFQKEKFSNLSKKQIILSDRLEDFKNLIHNVFRDSSETEAFITKNTNDFENLKEVVGKLKINLEEIEELLQENVIASSSSLMESLVDSIEKVKKDNQNLKILQEKINNMLVGHENKITSNTNNLIQNAREHAKDLSQRSKVIVNLFQISKDGAKYALLAGSAHKNITDAIIDAQQASKKAYNAAVFSNQRLNPKSPDEETIFEKGSDLTLESTAIQQDAQVQINKIEGKYNLFKI